MMRPTGRRYAGAYARRDHRHVVAVSSNGGSRLMPCWRTIPSRRDRTERTICCAKHSSLLPANQIHAAAKRYEGRTVSSLNGLSELINVVRQHVGNDVHLRRELVRDFLPAVVDQLG